MTLTELTRGSILSACGAGAFQRGEDYARNKRVLELDFDPEIQVIQAQVAGSGGRIYEQDIQLFPGSRHVRIQGFCDCPVGFNCKHIVAVLLTLEGQQARGGGVGADHQALKLWQRRFQAVTGRTKPTRSANGEQLIYLLCSVREDVGLSLSLRRRKRKKNGDWGKPRSLPGGYWDLDYEGYLGEDDWAIVGILGEPGGAWDFELDGRLGELALQDILQTGRAFLGEQLLPIKQGPQRSLGCDWEHTDDERIQLRVSLEDCAGNWRVIATKPPYYVDEDAGLCGPLDTPLEGSEVLLLRRMPAVPAAAQLEMAQFLAAELPPQSLPLPLDNLRSLSAEPLSLICLAGREQNGWAYHYLSIYFLYDQQRVAAFPRLATQILESGEGQMLLHRDQGFEGKIIDELEEYGFEIYHLSPRENDDIGLLLQDDDVKPSPLRWQAFLDHQLPELRQRGWQVEIDASFQLEVKRAERLSGELSEDSLGIQVAFDGQEIPLLPLLLQALEQGGDLDTDMAVEIKPDHWLTVPAVWLRPVLNTLIELHEVPDLDDRGRLRLHKHNLAPITQLEEELGESQFRWSGGEQRRVLARQLKDLKGVEAVAPPKGLKATLRSYQCEGLSWLVFLHRFGFGGILADDMGLGKTLQTLAFIQHLKARKLLSRPALVVAPTSLLGNWLHEAGKFTPGLAVAISHGPQRQGVLRALDTYDLVITSYALAQRDEEVLAEFPFSLLVLDEAQAIKNPRAKISRALRAYQAEHRLCLTGTPLENHLGEFWSQFDFTMPGLLGNQRSFNQLYRKAIEKEGDDSRRQQLQRRTAPFLLRRTKDQVAKELPAKTEIVQTVILDGAQQKLYQTVRASLEKEVRQLLHAKGLAKSHIQVLDALLKLRQICCDPSLVKLPSAAKVKQSAKLEALLVMLEEQLAEGRRILLFSQFTSMLAIVERELKQREIDYVKLTGQTRKRDKAITAFQSGEVPLFLISLKAGGFGLNLTAADTVIHYDPWWNPAVEKQATDRAHRIGQTKPVFVYKLIAADTIEERIQGLQQHKQALADALLSGESASLSQLSGEEILQLFC